MSEDVAQQHVDLRLAELDDVLEGSALGPQISKQGDACVEDLGIRACKSLPMLVHRAVIDARVS